MTARALLLQFLCAGVTLVAANVAVQCLAQNSVPRQMLRAAQQTTGVTDLFLGNSTMAAGLDERAFAAERPAARPLNLGLGTSSPVEHYLLYRQWRADAAARVYYGFLDTQLTDPPAGSWDTLAGNRALAYYAEPEVARQLYAPHSLWQRLAFRVCGYLPVVVERYAIWANVERLRRRLGALGLPARAENRFGRAEDFALLELEYAEFVARCERAVAERAPLNAALVALFAQARLAGHSLYVIEMPMPARHCARYYRHSVWQAYQAHLRDLVHAAGGVYVEASEWIADEGFVDPLHLNAQGATQFSAQLSRVRWEK
jgi:hypothetical protein